MKPFCSNHPPYQVILCANYSPWSAYQGGIQKSVHFLGEALVQQGVSTAVVFTRSPWEKIVAPATSYDLYWSPFLGIRPGVSSPARWLNGIPMALTIRKIAGPDTVIHGHGDEAWFLRRLLPRQPLVYQWRQPFMPTRSPWNPINQWRYLVLQPRVWAYLQGACQADILTTTSRFVQQGLRKLQLNPHPIRIPNGMDPAFLQVPMLPEQRRGILFFGRLDLSKGILELLRAYQQLPASLQKRHPLTLIGGGQSRDQISRWIQEHPCACPVHIHPSLPPDLLATEVEKAFLVVLPSHSESFGNTMLEATATGQRIISTQAGSIPEIMQNHADLVAPHQVKELYQMIQKRLLQPLPDIQSCQQQRDYVARHYSWAHSARLSQILYEEARHAQSLLSTSRS